MLTIHLRERDAQEAAKGEALALDRVKCAIEVALRQRKDRAERKASRPSKLAPPKLPRGWKQLSTTVQGAWPTKLLRLAVWERSEGHCENADCGARITWDNFHLDHALGRARAAQAPENCWALCVKCHEDRHAARPSRRYWLLNFLRHLEQHGFGHSETAKAIRDELAAEEQLQEAQRHAALAVSSAEDLAERARRAKGASDAG